MRTIAIAGVGLIGGSFGLALRKAGYDGRILGVSSPKTIEAAIERGAIDTGVTLEQAAAEADVILLAQPIGVILETIDKLAPIARPDCLITDAGSTKVQIVERARKLPLFLGGHPMAGKESTGVSFAEAELFQNRTWIFTQPETQVMESKVAQSFITWVQLCGAVCFFLSPSEHDRTIAWTSHLPQLISTVLAASLYEQLPLDQIVTLSGPGLRDTTRLGGSSWGVWADIIKSNTESIQHVLSVYIDRLTEMRHNLQTQRTSEEFAVAAEVVRAIRRGRQN